MKLTNILKRYWTIIVGFVFLAMVHLIDYMIDDINWQIALRIVCLIGAVVSFIAAVVTDEKLSAKQMLKNKWVICLLVLALIFIILLVTAILIR